MIDDEDTEKEKRNFLAAYHILKFSKDDQNDTEAVDIERRCLAAKYMTAKKSESEEMASCVLRRGLEDYQMLMENKDGVNNYWKQFKIQSQKVNNDPRKWTSGLNDVQIALGFVKPLPCQRDNTMPCRRKVLTDEYIRTILDMWRNQDTSGRNRKISVQEKFNITKAANTKDTLMFDENIQATSFSHFSNIYEDRSDDSQVSSARRQMTKLHSNPHETQNFQRQRSVKFEQKPLPKLTNVRDSSTSVRKKNYEHPNTYKSIPKSNPQVPPQQNEEDIEMQKPKPNVFRTARQELSVQQSKSNRPPQKKTLGGKQSVNSQFVCPLKREKEKSMQAQDGTSDTGSSSAEQEDERLKNIEPKMVELITNEIMDSKTTICWDDIAGLEYAKKIIKEVVVYPMLRPDIFTGLRRPPKGILLFGPPGTGKTLIGKCIASQSKSTFFSISASSLTSKWIGEGEKMVRALFAVARVYQPSVIFVDEIDSLLTQRSETEHESSRRLKTEFLVQLDGAATAEDDRILIVGATNRPQELDEAARRRLVKRLYVPLPELQARKQIINNLLLTVPHDLTDEDVTHVAEQSKGYSGADMSNLCKEASMGPIRSIPFSQLENISKEDVRHVTVDDFRDALIHVRPSVSESSLTTYLEWDSIYGTGTAQSYKG